MRSRLIAAIGLLSVIEGCAGTRVLCRLQILHPALTSGVVAADLPCVQTGHGCIPLNPRTLMGVDIGFSWSQSGGIDLTGRPKSGRSAVDG